MSNSSQSAYSQALRYFHNARNQAALERIVGRLRGEPTELLPFEEVRLGLKGDVAAKAELRSIPLKSIIGSVGRYHDFTRSFLPRKAQSSERWAKIELLFDAGNVPPIYVYQVGEAYFVVDGNHRVSVARDRRMTHLDAYVTRVETRVPLSPDDAIDDLLIKSEYADFLVATELDRNRSGVAFPVTSPGRYADFLYEIRRYQAALEEERSETITLADAAALWYDSVYVPVIDEIKESDLLRSFPGRTATDLYAWLIRYWDEIEDVLGWRPDVTLTLAHFQADHSENPTQAMARAGRRLRGHFLPGILAAGPRPGHWRDARERTRRRDRLFADILVGIDGAERGWAAAEQAWLIAGYEQGRVHGLHVAPPDAAPGAIRTVEEEFDRRRIEAGIPGRLSVETGSVEEQLIQRARWFDLMVLPLTHPPGEQGLSRLGNGLRAILHRGSSPVLVVPDRAIAPTHALLAYDGSRKAQEALFVAAYLADRHGLRLTLTGIVGVRGVTTNTLYGAVDYLLDAGVQHAVVTLGAASDSASSVGAAIYHALDASQADLLIMGGYGRGPLLEAVQGSAVDELLRKIMETPILFCR
ncbi:MAG: universal stress protein [Caldilineaceae bacterium]|nr:universal stress protein [Caldilineaceae bacterium]